MEKPCILEFSDNKFKKIKTNQLLNLVGKMYNIYSQMSYQTDENSKNKKK